MTAAHAVLSYMAAGQLLPPEQRLTDRSACLAIGDSTSTLGGNLNTHLGQPGWLSGLVSPSAQGVILETRDGVPRRAPCTEPASPSASIYASLSLSLSLSLMNK